MADNTNGSKNAGNETGGDVLKDFWALDDSSLFDDSDELPLIDEDKLWNEVLESYRSKNPDSYSAKRTVEVAREVGIKSEPSVSVRPRSFDSAASRADTNEISNLKTSSFSKKETENDISGRVNVVARETGQVQKSETKNSKTVQRNQKQQAVQKNQMSASRSTSSMAAQKSASSKKTASKTAPASKSKARKSGSASSSGKSQMSRIQKTTASGTVIKSQASNAAQGGKKKNTGKKYKDSRTPGQKIRKFIICLILWIIVIVLCCYAFKFGFDIFYDLPMDSSDLTKIEITIDGYETDVEVGAILLEYDLIDNLFIFKIRCLIYDSDYIAGTYSLSRSYNTEKILNILAGYDYSDGTLDE